MPSNIILKQFTNDGEILEISDLDYNFASLLRAIQGVTQTPYGTLWFYNGTNPPTYYIRIEPLVPTDNVTWQDIKGASVTLTDEVARNLQPVSSASNIYNQTITYVATAGGNGYVENDILVHFIGIDTFSPQPYVAYSYWVNAGPSVPAAEILSGYPTVGTYTTINGLGSQSTSGYDITKIGGTSISLGQKTLDASIPVVLPANQLANLAKENGGNLDAITIQLSNLNSHAIDSVEQQINTNSVLNDTNTLLNNTNNNLGTDTTGVVNPATGIRGWLSGLYKLFTNPSNPPYVQLMPGSNITVSGITAAPDVKDVLTLTSQYGGNPHPATSYTDILLNGAGTLFLQLESNTGSGTPNIEVYGCVGDYTSVYTLVGPLELNPIAQYNNSGFSGPAISAITDKLNAYYLSVAGLGMVQIRCNDPNASVGSPNVVSYKVSPVPPPQPKPLRDSFTVSTSVTGLSSNSTSIFLDMTPTVGKMRISHIKVTGVSASASGGYFVLNVIRLRNNKNNPYSSNGTVATTTYPIRNDNTVAEWNEGMNSIPIRSYSGSSPTPITGVAQESMGILVVALPSVSTPGTNIEVTPVELVYSGDNDNRPIVFDTNDVLAFELVPSMNTPNISGIFTINIHGDFIGSIGS